MIFSKAKTVVARVISRTGGRHASCRTRRIVLVFQLCFILFLRCLVARKKTDNRPKWTEAGIEFYDNSIELIALFDDESLLGHIVGPSYRQQQNQILGITERAYRLRLCTRYQLFSVLNSHHDSQDVRTLALSKRTTTFPNNLIPNNLLLYISP